MYTSIYSSWEACALSPIKLNIHASPQDQGLKFGGEGGENSNEDNWLIIEARKPDRQL